MAAWFVAVLGLADLHRRRRVVSEQRSVGGDESFAVGEIIMEDLPVAKRAAGQPDTGKREPASVSCSQRAAHRPAGKFAPGKQRDRLSFRREVREGTNPKHSIPLRSLPFFVGRCSLSLDLRRIAPWVS